jgi:N-acetylglucosaminyl-diphospho-decaprenol L-rhamnosyltransferase
MVSDCVDSLSGQDLHEIVIVNNSPTAAESKVLAALSERVRSVRIVEAGENIGFGAAINLAVSTTRVEDTDRIWLVNPDVLITHPDTARALSNTLDDGFDIVSPAIVTDGTTEQLMWYGGGTFDAKRGLTIHWNDGVPLSALPKAQGAEKVSFITGAAMMLSGRAWHLLGGFREDLFLYWEDAELCLRATDNGLSLAVVPDVTVWHKVGATSSETGKSAIYFYYMNRNRLVVCSERTNLRSLLVGPGTMWTIRFLARAARSDRSLKKLSSALRGLLSGIKVARKVF